MNLQLPKGFSEYDLVASISRESFYDFVKEFWHIVIMEKPVWNWHIEFLCNELQEVAERIFRNEPKKYDLIINICPGSTKSTVASVMFPIWCWTRMPSMRSICGSYSEKLAMDLSRKSRDVLQSELFQRCFPGLSLRDDQNAKGYFANNRAGFRYSVGVNGSVTGFHAHLLLIDDPLDPMQAVSELELNSANDWLQNTLSQRKVDKQISVQILIMQRLHQDDPTALFLRRGGVRHVCIPAMVTQDIKPKTLRSYYVDGLMDPIRIPRTVLEDEMKKGNYFFSGQFLQNPIPLGGGMFKTDKLRIVEPPKKFKKIIRSWDKAGTIDGGMYTAGVKIGEDLDGRFWILDVKRQQLDSFAREAMMLATARQDGKHVVIGLEEEPGSGGKESAESSVRRFRGYSVRVKKVGKSDGDKALRADPFSVQVNAGNVLLAPGNWNEEYIDEMRFFPFSKYKDQMDASSNGFNMLTRRQIIVGGLW